MIFGNGAWLKTETGILFPQDQDTDGRVYDAEHTDWLNKLDAVIKQRKLGLAIFHYTMWVDNWVGKRFLMDWFGGNWLPYSSHNPVDTWTVSPLPVRHPILNGIQPWTYRDEMFSRYFLYHDPRRTELLQAMPATAKQWRARSGVLGVQPSRWRPLFRLGRLGLPRQHAQCARRTGNICSTPSPGSPAWTCRPTASTHRRRRRTIRQFLWSSPVDRHRDHRLDQRRQSLSRIQKSAPRTGATRTGDDQMRKYIAALSGRHGGRHFTAGSVLAQTAAPAVIEDFKPSSLNQPGQQYPQVNSQGYVRFQHRRAGRQERQGEPWPGRAGRHGADQGRGRRLDRHHRRARSTRAFIIIT